mgnify:CR=1 FL=1
MKIAIIIGAILLFIALCVVGFFLIRRTLYNMIDRRIERFQSELIEKQVREIQNMYRQVRGWRHDYRNHINNMKIQLSQENYDGLSDYLNELADDLDTVFFKYAVLIELCTAVKRGLSTKCEQNSVRLLFLNNLLDKVRGYRQEINAVGNTLRGLNCGNVRVDEDCADSLFT